MNFAENPDHAAIRETVAKIAAPYGGVYHTSCAEQHVSREMVLNYVAQHSLGLPRSY